MSTKNEHNIEGLPKWARELINHQQYKINELKRQKEVLEEMHEIMQKCSWFHLDGPEFVDDRETLKFYILYRNDPHCVCELSKGDKLFIGLKWLKDIEKIEGNDDLKKELEEKIKIELKSRDSND